jgi:phosphoglycolate phosphatase
MTKMLSLPRAVLFDWDGTLVDSFQAIYEAQLEVRRHFNQPPLTKDEVIQSMKIGTAREVFRVFYPGQEKEALDVYYNAVPRLRAQHISVHAGSEAAIQALRARDIPCGVVSNMAHDPLVHEIGLLTWDQYFQVVIGAGVASRGKPAPDPVYLALDRMDIPRDQAGQVWFIGDMETDQKAAHAARCKFLYYTGGITHDESLPADWRFADYQDLENIIRNIV